MSLFGQQKRNYENRRPSKTGFITSCRSGLYFRVPLGRLP